MTERQWLGKFDFDLDLEACEWLLEEEKTRGPARELDLGQHLAAASRERAWPTKHLALLGTAPDAEVAARIGRTEGAVTLKRCRLRIPTARDRRREPRGGTRR
jgi:hypothetical protein